MTGIEAWKHDSALAQTTTARADRDVLQTNLSDRPQADVYSCLFAVSPFTNNLF
jgi:hypothetical protein